MSRAIDKSLGDYGNACQIADEKRSAAFDKEIALVRKLRREKADDRQRLIDTIGVEKATFEKHGTIPFSPRMRDRAIQYLNSLGKARQPLSKTYDEAIRHFQKENDDDAASEVTAEKEKVLAPKVVGVWRCEGGRTKFTFTLYSDGTGAPDRTWTLGNDGMVVTNRSPRAPKGGYIDKCVIDETGRSLVLKNQEGFSVKGKRIDPDPKAD